MPGHEKSIYSSNEEFSAATAEVTEATTEITTAIMMIKSPPANKKNIPFILKTPFYRLFLSVSISFFPENHNVYFKMK